MVFSPAIDDPSPVQFFKHDSLPFAVSVGLHAIVLGLLLPNLSGFNREANVNSASNPHNVSVIKLSPAEQSRLPNLPSTASALPPTAGLNPLNTEPPYPSLGSPLSFPSSISALPPPPSLPPLGNSNSYPFPIRTVPNPSILPYRSYSSPSYAPYPPTVLRSPTPLNPLELPNRGLNPIPIGERPQFVAPRSPIPADDLINGRGLSGQTPENGQSVALNSGSTPNQVPAASPEDVRFSGENTSDEEAVRNNIRWMAKAGELKPQALSVAGNYPTPACPSQVQGSAIIGVAANEQGQVAAEPYLIKSSGFAILNRQALQDVRSQRLPGQGAYRVTVNYDYNAKVCPAIARTQPNLPLLPPDRPSNQPGTQPGTTPDLPQPVNATPNGRSLLPTNSPPNTRSQPNPTSLPVETRRNPATVAPPSGPPVPARSEPKPSPGETQQELPTVKPSPESLPARTGIKPLPVATPEARSNLPSPTSEAPSPNSTPGNAPISLPPAPSSIKKTTPSPAQVDPQVNEALPKSPQG
jgi:hypothetical protein